MDKEKKTKNKTRHKVDKIVKNKEINNYDYDFVPNLNEWLNIDKQKEKAKELEDI